MLFAANYPDREDESSDLVDRKQGNRDDVELNVMKVDWGADPLAGMVV